MMLIDNKFNIGDVVYLRTDIEQDERIVTQLTVTIVGILYQLSCGTMVTNHYDVEIATEKVLQL